MHKIYRTVIIVLLIINIVFGYIVFNDRIGQNKIRGINKQLNSEINSTRSRISELERIQQTDKGTISNLRNNQQRLEATNQRLTELLQQQGNSISTIESEFSEDRKDLQRLQQIIKTLPKAK